MEIVKNNSDSSVSLWRNPCEVDQIKEGKHFFYVLVVFSAQSVHSSSYTVVCLSC